MQLPVCVPPQGELSDFGQYHMSLVVDVAQNDSVDTEQCREALLTTMEGLAVIAEETGGRVPSFCGRQWAGWESLSFARELLPPVIPQTVCTSVRVSFSQSTRPSMLLQNLHVLHGWHGADKIFWYLPRMKGRVHWCR